MDPVSVGVLGCGTISDAYFGADDRFENYEIVAGADLAGHVLDVLSGIREASTSGTHVTVDRTVDWPTPLPAEFPAGLWPPIVSGR